MNPETASVIEPHPERMMNECPSVEPQSAEGWRLPGVLREGAIERSPFEELETSLVSLVTASEGTAIETAGERDSPDRRELESLFVGLGMAID